MHKILFGQNNKEGSLDFASYHTLKDPRWFSTMISSQLNYKKYVCNIMNIYMHMCKVIEHTGESLTDLSSVTCTIFKVMMASPLSLIAFCALDNQLTLMAVCNVPFAQSRYMTVIYNIFADLQHLLPGSVKKTPIGENTFAL